MLQNSLEDYFPEFFESLEAAEKDMEKSNSDAIPGSLSPELDLIPTISYTFPASSSFSSYPATTPIVYVTAAMTDTDDASQLQATPSTSFVSSFTGIDSSSIPTTSSSSTSVSALESLSATLFHLGPGVVLTDHTTSTLDLHSPMPTSPVAFAAAPTSSNAGAAHDTSDHRMPIIFGSILSGLLVFSIITCVLLNTKRLRCKLFARGVHHDLDSRVVKDLEDSSVFPVEAKGSGNADGSQPALSSLPAWMKLPSQISPFHNHRDSLLSYFRSGRDSLGSQQSKPQKPQKDKVIDIVSDFPRSRFSVTSSDYTHSIRSVDSNRYLQPVAPPRQSVPLLTPEEFFSLPSSTTIASRHSRMGSAPVFGFRRREAGLSLALSRARSLEQEVLPNTKSKIKDRAKSMAFVQDRSLQRRRTQSVAVIGNGEWI
ncbi:hypothetical protein BT96DRAFT_914268 [Gymnopus androsaceus JB14]|uniref:Uncharacterized protein n=1 Tax=Gymnopus androsaceus JB14 TaxID=1447944 RepID=A0A6A4I7A7_9AGAR|nr:hypothetical protein BT96DRAFT_914268 [Gymnopus androsaceus JB14]